MFSAAYYWLPKWCGRMYDEKLGKWHFWMTMISFNIAFFPMHFLGLAGMPRRIADYPAQFRSEEHTSELQSLMRTSYAVFCLKKKKNNLYHIDCNMYSNNSQFASPYILVQNDTQTFRLYTHT